MSFCTKIITVSACSRQERRLKYELEMQPWVRLKRPGELQYRLVQFHAAGQRKSQFGRGDLLHR